MDILERFVGELSEMEQYLEVMPVICQFRNPKVKYFP